MTVLYNEIDPFAARWLRNLAAAGEIAFGDVLETPLQNIDPDVLTTLTQFHTCAGIGTWSRALRDAGWPEEAEVWTASLPCQSFSTAGRRKGFSDERHLFPAYFKLVQACQPPVLLFEQVASKDGIHWLDVVCDALEGEGYAVQAAVLPACGIGAPHLRNRTYAVAVADGERLQRLRVLLQSRQPREVRSETGGSSTPVGVGNSSSTGTGWNPGSISCEETETSDGGYRYWRVPNESIPSGTVRGVWAEAVEWIACGDGKIRPTKSGTFPLVNGTPRGMGQARSSRLKGYGNGIVLPLATVVIETLIETLLG